MDKYQAVFHTFRHVEVKDNNPSLFTAAYLIWCKTTWRGMTRKTVVPLVGFAIEDEQNFKVQITLSKESHTMHETFVLNVRLMESFYTP